MFDEEIPKAIRDIDAVIEVLRKYSKDGFNDYVSKYTLPPLVQYVIPPLIQARNNLTLLYERKKVSENE